MEPFALPMRLPMGLARSGSAALSALLLWCGMYLAVVDAQYSGSDPVRRASCSAGVVCAA